MRTFRLAGLLLAAPHAGASPLAIAVAVDEPSTQASPSVDAAARDETLSRLVVYAELSSWFMVTRPGLGADLRLASFADGRLHLLGDLGLGASSHYLATLQPRATATLGLLSGRGPHHAELHLGGDVVANTLSDTGPYAYPVAVVGYRWQRPGDGLVVSVLAGTTGVGVRVGRAW